ncbi:MAG: hypothetical protein ACRC10_02910 [Thermoguttaceae bacterium]
MRLRLYEIVPGRFVQKWLQYGNNSDTLAVFTDYPVLTRSYGV